MLATGFDYFRGTATRKPLQITGFSTPKTPNRV